MQIKTETPQAGDTLGAEPSSGLTAQPASEADDAEPEVPAGVVAQLVFDFLRQLSTLSLAAAGGAVTLMQTALADSEFQGALIGGVASLFLAAIFSLQTQQVFVERLAHKTRTLKPAKTAVERFNMKRTPKTERVLTYLSFGLFGLGVTMVVWVVVMEFLLGSG